MIERKMHTAQEMRSVAKSYNCSEVTISYDKRYVASMLRQAADAEEENAQLKARLEAVVNECEKCIKDYGCGACTFVDEPPWTVEQCEIKGCSTRLHAMEFLLILRAAKERR